MVDLYLIKLAPWCGHCKNFASDYKKLARMLRGVLKVGAVDMTKYEVILKRHMLTYYRILDLSLECKDFRRSFSLLQGKSSHISLMDSEQWME